MQMHQRLPDMGKPFIRSPVIQIFHGQGISLFCRLIEVCNRHRLVWHHSMEHPVVVKISLKPADQMAIRIVCLISRVDTHVHALISVFRHRLGRDTFFRIVA